jgi:polysaccharide biosynthesis protein PslG
MKFTVPDHILKRLIATLLAINAVLLVLILAGRTPDRPPQPVAGGDPTATPDPVHEVQVNQRVASPTPAIQASLWWDSVVANRDLGLVNRLGFHWAKQVFAWREIEPNQKGTFEWEQADQVVAAAEAHDLLLIARLDREPIWERPADTPADVLTAPPQNVQDFADFCQATASRYRGRAIKAYEVWNEPNLAREWGGNPPDPAAYTGLLAACYQGIRQGDPDALVISAGLAPTGTSTSEAMPDEDFLRGMYQAGAASSFDMLGVNAPGYAAPPQASPDEVANTAAWGAQRWACFRHVEDMRRIMLENGDGAKQIAVMEMGWTTDKIHPDYSWFAVTQQQQAEYLAGAYWWARLNWQPWIGFMSAIYIADPYWTPNDEEFWWSITVPNFPRPMTLPAFNALSKLPDWSADYSASQLPPPTDTGEATLVPDS